MKTVMIRVGIDSGCGGIQGPLFLDGTFEYIPIPDDHVVDDRTYGNTKGRHSGSHIGYHSDNCGSLIDYFPLSRQSKMMNQSIHFDPEFETYTYGDPTRPKSSLKKLEEGDMLIFFCGLEGLDFECEPAIYLMGYFEVLTAGIAANFEPDVIDNLFTKNFHVMHRDRFNEQKDRLVLVKGSNESRLLKKAVLISTMDRDKAGRPLKILSPEMRKTFGDFHGHLAIQRSPPRWVDPLFAEKAAEFMRSCD
jgi:hypothetical protein